MRIKDVNYNIIINARPTEKKKAPKTIATNRPKLQLRSVRNKRIFFRFKMCTVNVIFNLRFCCRNRHSTTNLKHNDTAGPLVFFSRLIFRLFFFSANGV